MCGTLQLANDGQSSNEKLKEGYEQNQVLQGGCRNECRNYVSIYRTMYVFMYGCMYWCSEHD